MKKLVQSQETYIKELESKLTNLEEVVEQKNQDTTQFGPADWQKEKLILSELVVKNQQIAEDLEYKMK